MTRVIYVTPTGKASPCPVTAALAAISRPVTLSTRLAPPAVLRKVSE